MTSPYIDKIGVNTHIDFAYKDSPYLDLTKVIRCIKYLGVKHLRDGAGKVDTVTKWVAVRNETKARFCAYLPNGAPAFVQQCLAYWPELYRNGLIDMFEGPNEPDKPYSINLGYSIDQAVAFTKGPVSVFAKSVGKLLVNLSVGAGWTSADGWKGNYDALPDMSAVCDYGNAHVYPNKGQDVYSTTLRLLNLAALSMPGRSDMVTEIGWDMAAGHTEESIAADAVRIVNSGLAPRYYFYALFDDQSGRFGLFNTDGTPRLVATALRRLLIP